MRSSPTAWRRSSTRCARATPQSPCEPSGKVALTCGDDKRGCWTCGTGRRDTTRDRRMCRGGAPRGRTARRPLPDQQAGRLAAPARAEGGRARRRRARRPTAPVFGRPPCGRRPARLLRPAPRATHVGARVDRRRGAGRARVLDADRRHRRLVAARPPPPRGSRSRRWSSSRGSAGVYTSAASTAASAAGEDPRLRAAVAVVFSWDIDSRWQPEHNPARTSEVELRFGGGSGAGPRGAQDRHLDRTARAGSRCGTR